MADLIADPFRAARLVLHLRQEGIMDSDVLKAMETIDRSAFVDLSLAHLAFEDCVLPIACGQIIPKPSVTGKLLQALQLETVKDARILVVGVGSGYMAALVAQLGAEVFAVERFRRLADTTRTRLLDLDVANVAVRHGDGLEGWADRGPYQRILLSGAIDEVPDVLLQQLTPDGALIAVMTAEVGSVLMRIDANGTAERLQVIESLPKLVAGKSRAL
jgi:protein-L-isoaspartate(D-aspartate) O-methyltransferase